MILESIGCNFIKYHPTNNYYSCSNYDGDRPDAVNVKNDEYLSVRNWTRDFAEHSDLITLVEYNKKISFLDAVKYIHSVLGLEYRYTKKQKPQKKKMCTADVLMRYRAWRNKEQEVIPIDESVLDEYVPLLYIGWLREGIMPTTAKKFGIEYSYKRKRVIIPVRYWLTGELLATNARTVVDNYKELGIKKYYMTASYKKNLNIYGLWENYKSIQIAGYVVVYEAEKSVLKRDSLMDGTGVALAGHQISIEQRAILLGLGVEIVFAMDKDISIGQVRTLCDPFYQKRKVSYIWDNEDLLGEKDSPADAGDAVYQKLFKNRVIYDEAEHKRYMKSLEKKGK